MNRHRFGQFLINKGLVTQSDINTALSRQIARQDQIGQIAIKSGMLTVKQVMHILREQAGTCYFFGELAVQLGYLNEAGIQKLINLQQETRPKLGEILIELGRLESWQLDELLAEFEKVVRTVRPVPVISTRRKPCKTKTERPVAKKKTPARRKSGATG